MKKLMLAVALTIGLFGCNVGQHAQHNNQPKTISESTTQISKQDPVACISKQFARFAGAYLKTLQPGLTGDWVHVACSNAIIDQVIPNAPAKVAEYMKKHINQMSDLCIKTYKDPLIRPITDQTDAVMTLNKLVLICGVADLSKLK